MRGYDATNQHMDDAAPEVARPAAMKQTAVERLALHRASEPAAAAPPDAGPATPRAGGAREAWAPQDVFDALGLPSRAALRRKASGSPSAAADAGATDEQATARQGFAGAAADYPHRAAIERSFGAPLQATAYTGAAATAAAARLGANAYALGDQVAFASDSPSLEVAAHEAAHVMQATSGVQLHGGGEGEHEAHADAVAARVVRGESARDLLAPAAPAAPAVRRNKDPDKLAKELAALIDHAVWKEIRKTAYPKESAAGIARAKERKQGTRPDLTGLGKISTLEHFAGEVKALQKLWPTLKKPERLAKLAQAINTEMTGADVPPFEKVDSEVIEFKGYFSHGLWKFVVSDALLTASPLPDADAAELCNTALHEARHAEQAFLAARYAAGPPNNDDATTIASAQGIPKKIAKLAVAKKLDAKSDPQVAALAKSMYDANVTNGAANQQISDDDYLKEMEQVRGKARTALKDLQSSATSSTIAAATTARDELRAAIAEVERRYTLYRNIPYEADAHEVGDAAEQAFKGWP